MVLAFETIDVGRKIFRGWHKKLAETHRADWISITVITGIHRDRPLDYRVAIGVGEQYMRNKMSGKMRLMATVYRMHDMTPASGRNLELLLDMYSQTGRFILQPGLFSVSQSGVLLTSEDVKLGIEMACLTVVPAWQVEPSSRLFAAMRDIEQPFIPAGVVNAPFAEK